MSSWITSSANSINHPNVDVISDRVKTRSNRTRSSDGLERSAMDDNLDDGDIADEESLEDHEFDEENNGELPSNQIGNNGNQHDPNCVNVYYGKRMGFNAREVSGNIGEAAGAAKGAEAARTMTEQDWKNWQKNQERNIQRIDSYTEKLSDVQVELHIALINDRFRANSTTPSVQHSVRNNIEYTFPMYPDYPDGQASTSQVSDSEKKTRKTLLQALIRSQGPVWEQFLYDHSHLNQFINDPTDVDAIQPVPLEQNLPDDQQRSSLALESNVSCGETFSQPSPSRRRQSYSFFRWVPCLSRGRITNENEEPLNAVISIELRDFSRTGQNAENGSVASVRRSDDANPWYGQYFSSNKRNIFYGSLTVITVLLIAILGAACFIFINPSITDTQSESEPPKFTKTDLQSRPINASNAKMQLTFDPFHDMILLSKQHHDYNESSIKTTILDGAFLHEEEVLDRFVKTNELCVQVSLEIVCCETFCEGKLKEGLIITRHFSRHSQFCGAWRYELNSAYICTRKKDQITITEFWSAKDYRFSHPSLNIAEFQAIDYLPNHIAVILTKSSSNSDQFCLANFGRRSIKKIKCHDIGFLGLEPVQKSTTRHIVYLQDVTWAVLTSKIVNNSLEWTVAVFKEKRLIFKDTDKLLSESNQLIAFGSHGKITVCGIAIQVVSSGSKAVSCKEYKFEA